jgi:glycerophosphoryl diester phosphodiesterase
VAARARRVLGATLLLVSFALSATLAAVRYERPSRAGLIAGATLVAAAYGLRTWGLAARTSRALALARGLAGCGGLVALGPVEPLAVYALSLAAGTAAAPRRGRPVGEGVRAPLVLGAIALLGFAAASPRAQGFPVRASPAPWESGRPFVIAHRGAHARSPENSLGAIRETASVGALMAEVDVLETLDGAFVLHHDRSVERMTDGTGEVARLTLAELRRLRLKGPDGRLTEERIPSLDEALSVARGRVVLYIDARNAPAVALASALRGTDYGSVLVYHDRWSWLAQFHAAAPQVPLLPEARNPWAIRSAARELDALIFASGLARFDAGDALVAHALGGRILVDVLGRDEHPEARIREALERGADGVQTNDPSSAVAIVASWR